MCNRYSYRAIADYAYRRGVRATTNARMQSRWFHVFDVASMFAGMNERFGAPSR